MKYFNYSSNKMDSYIINQVKLSICLMRNEGKYGKKVCPIPGSILK